MKQNTFRTPDELLQVFRFHSVDKVGKLTVFNIGGRSAVRLITAIHYNRQKVYIRNVLTHTEYETGKWKKETMIKQNQIKESSNGLSGLEKPETSKTKNGSATLSLVPVIENLIEAIGESQTHLYASLTEWEYQNL